MWRELKIDMKGRLGELVQPITESRRIYDAARAQMQRDGRGYEEL